MRRWHWQDARGMTLMELLIVIAIFTLVMGAVSSVFMASLQAYWKGDQNTQVQQAGRVALDRLTRDFRQSRRLCLTAPACGTQGGFTFNVNGGFGACATPPQISFVLPHFGTVTLSDNTTHIWMTDAKPTAPNQGQIPYDGSYVSYYLSSSQNTPGPPASWPPLNTAGPYLIRVVYDTTALTVSWATIATNITVLTVSDAGGCPSANSREVTVTLTASMSSNQPGVPPSSQTVTTDILLRNPPSP